MRRKLLVGTSVLVLGGCGLFIGLDQPSYDNGAPTTADASPADGTSPTDAATTFTTSAFEDPSRWSSYGKSGGGFTAGPSDGRFIYFLRTNDVDGPDAGLTGARILRYDSTSATFEDDAAWTSFDAEALATSGGHLAAVLEGKWLVIAANDDHRFLRYDTTRPLTDFALAASWDVFDSAPYGLTTTGYNAAVPVDGGAFYNDGTHLTPLEHSGDTFDAGWSVAAIDAGTFDCANTFQGACAGGQLFFGPAGGNGPSCLARFDPAAADFGTSAGWDSVDLTTLAPENAFLSGVIPSDQHLYFTQYATIDASTPVKVLRKPFAGNLDAGFESEATNVKNPLTRGFFGGVFDGRFVYFAPYPTSSSAAIFSRYDTTLGFTDATAWSVTAAAEVGIPANRFRGAVFDGQYVYFPSFAGINGETPTFARYKAYDAPIAVPGPCH